MEGSGRCFASSMERDTDTAEHYLQPARSHLSFAFAAAVVCHCMLEGESGPPQASGLIWSTTYPGHAPLVFPVEGQGCDVSNECFAEVLRAIRPREFLAGAIVDRGMGEGLRVIGLVARAAGRGAGAAFA